MKIHFNIRDETDETEETLHVHYLIILLTFPDWNESIGISNTLLQCDFVVSNASLVAYPLIQRISFLVTV
jgi:hypothetical protein